MRDLSSQLATEIFVPTKHCRTRIMPLVAAVDWASIPRATLEDLVRADQAEVAMAAGQSFSRPYFSLPRQVHWVSGGTTEIKVALNVTGLLSEAPSASNRSLSYHDPPRPAHAPIQTAPPLIYNAIVVIMHARDEQARPGSTSAQWHSSESELIGEFLGLVTVVELVDEHGARELQGSLDSWRRFVRLLNPELYEATRRFVARGGLGGHFAQDAATWFVEHMAAPEEGEFNVFLRAVERAIRWVEMLFELDQSGRSRRPAFEFRSLEKAGHSAFLPRDRHLS
ncbi:hypothetical protein JCM9279_002086 [Rhodotorula babjevae]